MIKKKLEETGDIREELSNISKIPIEIDEILQRDSVFSLENLNFSQTKQFRN